MKVKLPIGTFINMAAVILGGSIGLLLQNSFPENIQAILFQAIGLGTLLMGIQMSLKLPEGYLLILIFSLVGGSILGESLQLNTQMENLSDTLKNAIQLENEHFSEGLVTAFILFCVGSMTILGAIEEGVSGKRELLSVKSLLDGTVSIAFASTYGVGVLFCVLPMLIFQGGITLLAVKMQRFFKENVIATISSVGGILIIGISINLLQLGSINIENLLPAIVLGIILSGLYERFK